MYKISELTIDIGQLWDSSLGKTIPTAPKIP